MSKIPVYYHRNCTADWGGECAGCVEAHKQKLIEDVVLAARRVVNDDAVIAAFDIVGNQSLMNLDIALELLDVDIAVESEIESK